MELPDELLQKFLVELLQKKIDGIPVESLSEISIAIPCRNPQRKLLELSEELSEYLPEEFVELLEKKISCLLKIGIHIEFSI